jgi:D-3-phosphoglycerate dehydrogenase
MNVLIADVFEQTGIDALKAGGCGVLYEPKLADEALTRAIVETAAEVLIVRSTRVGAAAFEAGSLQLVVRAGAGVNTIDVAAASRRGVYVGNCPGRNAAAVAELSIGLMIALDRRIPDNVADLRRGVWNKKGYSEASGLAGRTLGLLGFGHIGREVAFRAHALGMRLVVWSRRLAGANAEALAASIPMTVASSPSDAAEQSDVLSVHLALAPETRGLVDRALLERLHPGASFINTSRAEIVDYQALAAVAAERGLRVGLDVFAAEPSGGTGEFTDPIAALPFVYGTHHIGASTRQAQEAIAAETVRIVLAFKDTGRVPNAVNLATRTPATHMLIVRHRDRPGVLAHVFDRLRESGINVQETENIVFAGAEAAVARINVDAEPSEGTLALIREGNDDVIDVRTVEIRQT